MLYTNYYFLLIFRLIFDPEIKHDNETYLETIYKLKAHEYNLMFDILKIYVTLDVGILLI